MGLFGSVGVALAEASFPLLEGNRRDDCVNGQGKEEKQEGMHF